MTRSCAPQKLEHRECVVRRSLQIPPESAFSLHQINDRYTSAAIVSCSLLVCTSHAPPSCPILELGCGPGSTSMLHAQALLGRLVVSADSNMEWCDADNHSHPLHVFKRVEHPWTGWDALFRDEAVARDDWSIVFIDHWPSVLRPAALRHFRNLST